MTALERRWPTMGGEAAVWLAADRPEAELEDLAAGVRAVIDDAAARLTRFDPRSELSRLDPDRPASPVLRRFVLAARWAGEETDGLVDATLVEPLEAAGYASSRAGEAPLPLAEALRDAPERRPAGPSPVAGWRTLGLDVGGRVLHGEGVRLDSGGLGKGLAADMAAELLPPDVLHAISVGGDLAVGGPHAQDVDVRAALPGEGIAHRLRVRRGGVATSGIHRRVWRDADGRPAHHLLDPATGRPAWTGLIAVTAVGEDAVDAEARAKAALLSGPLGARRRLRRHGGILQHEDGRVEVVRPVPVVTLRRKAA